MNDLLRDGENGAGLDCRKSVGCGRLAEDVFEGFSNPQKSVPCRWLYDDRGSVLFELITKQEEYYPSRTELAILRKNRKEIAAFCGRRAILIEYGSGAAVKTEVLIDALDSPRMYVPIDIACEFLSLTTARFASKYTALCTKPILADFTNEFELPPWLPENRRVGFFPGSTIGNLSLPEVAEFLTRMRSHVGNGVALVGVDLVKNLEILLRAYDDSAGITAAFNLNLLHRLNRELNAGFDIPQFGHQARWNEMEQAVEMHLVARSAQSVVIKDRVFAISAEESIHTESSRKYTVTRFNQVARENGWVTERVWTDSDSLFAVFGLRASRPLVPHGA